MRGLPTTTPECTPQTPAILSAIPMDSAGGQMYILVDQSLSGVEMQRVEQENHIVAELL